MKKFMCVALACTVSVWMSFAQSAVVQAEKAPVKSSRWTDNFEMAKKDAKTFKQPIFALFTGSDWCPWCVKLNSEVLETKAFKAFAEKNLILFIADFPNGKKISDEVKAQNSDLAKKYSVGGFPTVLLLDAEGKQLLQTGYQRGGGEKYVASLQEKMKAAGVKTVSGKEE